MASLKPVFAASPATAVAVTAPHLTVFLTTTPMALSAFFPKFTTLRVALTISLETPFVFLAAFTSPPLMLSFRFRMVWITLATFFTSCQALGDGCRRQRHLLVKVQCPRPHQKPDLRGACRRQSVQRDAPGGVKRE